MVRRGYLRPLRSVLGVILMIAGVGQIIPIKVITDLISSYPTILSGILIASGYLLFRQNYPK